MSKPEDVAAALNEALDDIANACDQEQEQETHDYFYEDDEE